FVIIARRKISTMASALFLMFLVGCIHALPQPDFGNSSPSSSYGAPPASNSYGPSQPSYNSGGGGMPYDFSYGVNDAYSSSNYGQSEKSDGKNVQGYYTVDLPDGRKQTVKYTADHDRGFIAEVSYEGEAQYAPAAPAVTFFKGSGGGYGAGGGAGSSSGGYSPGAGGASSGGYSPGGGW
ncbi:unnamed protein product, partial [Meganyctiphanes norvegica]